MGYGYDAICKSCETKFPVSERSGMIAMPFHCDGCGKEWWWDSDRGDLWAKSLSPAVRIWRDVQGRCQAPLSQLWFVGIREGPGGSVDDLRLMPVKRCSTCERMKGLHEFDRSDVSKDGRPSRCKGCRAEDARLYAARRRWAETAAEARGAALARQGVDLGS